MKSVLFLGAALALVGAFALYSHQAKALTKKDNTMTDNSIIIYFSRADENYGVGYTTKGNTEYVAEFIQKNTGADIFKVEPATPYAKDYDTAVEEAKQRQKTHQAPIKAPVPDISKYDTIYIGSPVYWSYMPEELKNALTGLDFTGKTIRLFTTHEGSGLGSIPGQLRDVCPDAKFGKPLAIVGQEASKSEDEVKKWLSE